VRCHCGLSGIVLLPFSGERWLFDGAWECSPLTRLLLKKNIKISSPFKISIFPWLDVNAFVCIFCIWIYRILIFFLKRNCTCRERERERVIAILEKFQYMAWHGSQMEPPLIWTHSSWQVLYSSLSTAGSILDVGALREALSWHARILRNHDTREPSVHMRERNNPFDKI